MHRSKNIPLNESLCVPLYEILYGNIAPEKISTFQSFSSREIERYLFNVPENVQEYLSTPLPFGRKLFQPLKTANFDQIKTHEVPFFICNAGTNRFKNPLNRFYAILIHFELG